MAQAKVKAMCGQPILCIHYLNWFLMSIFKVGDLIKWTFYADGDPKEYIGLITMLSPVPIAGQGWGDMQVICNGKYEYWTSWQCEVIS